jgi:hypothetical protein
MKYILTILLALFATTAMAQSMPYSGTFYNPDRGGEGVNVTLSGNTLQFFFYTHDDWQGCPGIVIPLTGMVTGGNCHEQRFFMSSGDAFQFGTADGWLYTTLGLNHSVGIPDGTDPFIMHLAEAQIVGLYIMEKTLTGWQMVVVRFGKILKKNDSLYTQVYNFSDLIIAPTD